MPLSKMKVGPGRFTLYDGADATGTPTDFSCQLTATTVAWSDETGDPIDVLCGEEEPGDTTWSATIAGSMYQDPAILLPWTWENKGRTFFSRFVPSDAAGKMVTGRVTVKPLDFGGDVKTSATSDFEWSYVGEPQIENVPADYVPVHAAAEPAIGEEPAP